MGIPPQGLTRRACLAGLGCLVAAPAWAGPDPRIDALLMAAPPARPIEAHPAVMLLQAWVLGDPGRVDLELELLGERLPNRPRLACDLEGGRVNPLARHPLLESMPPAAHLGRGDPERTRTWGRRAARQLRELGLHLNLGPVLDVGQDGHLARQFRLFSDDPDTVVAHARAYVEGLATEGIPAIVKHYPGFGRAETDSDHVSTVIEASAEALAAERALFGRVPAAGIMLANATYPALDASPAPLSAAIVADARAHTGGVVVTDDLARLGTSFVDEDVLRGAFLAGADLLVTSVRLDEVLPVFRRVVGELLVERPVLWERVEASAARIARLRRTGER